MNIPKAITSIKLCYAFRGYITKIEQIISTTTLTIAQVIDSTQLGYSCFANGTEEETYNGKYFTVNNPHQKEVTLWPIDGVMFSKGTKCDCAIISDSYFCFIEFKANATSIQPDTVEATYKKAVSQIESTHNLVNQKLSSIGVDLHTTKEVEGHICMAQRFPRFNSTEQNYQIAFAQENGFPLYFDKKKTF